MYRTGHVGLGFLASIPLGAWALDRGVPGLALALTVTVVALSTLPDVDERLPGLEHRTWTHSLLFAGLVGLLTGFGWWLAALAVGSGDAIAMASLGALAGAVAVLTHLVGDVVTPLGVAPLWPVARRRRSLDLVPSKNPRTNYLLLASGTAGWVVFVGTDVGVLPA